mmetsp:Transcript_16563/g.46218  ORF Transcript_16563/g.46218 Transcript_16563/m.46218 type:complete len:185 (-) Transcript_16563:496-1050(-)
MSGNEDSVIVPKDRGAQSSGLFEGLEDNGDDLEEKEDGDEPVVGGKQPPHWTTPEIIATVYTVTAANRRKARATQVERAGWAKEHYAKFCANLVRADVWGPGNGHPDNKDSVTWRTSYLSTRKKKGKSPIFVKYANVIKEVRNNILPLVSLLLPGGQRQAVGRRLGGCEEQVLGLLEPEAIKVG